MYIEYTGRRIADKFSSTSAPWKITINNAYLICICIFFPPSRTFEPSGLQLYQRHIFFCDSNNSNELVMRRHQKKEGGNRTHFRPTLLPRGINTEFKI